MPEPCVVHGERLILCASCESERMERAKRQIARELENLRVRGLTLHAIAEFERALDRILR